MRQRLIASTLAVALAIVILVGLPAGFAQSDFIQQRELDRLQVEAEQILTVVRTADPVHGAHQVTPKALARYLKPGQWGQVDRAGQRSLRFGATDAYLGPTEPLTFDVADGGVRVTLAESRAAMDASIREAWLLLFALGLTASAAAVVMALLQARRLAGPLTDLVEVAERLGSGDARPMRRRYGVSELDRVADVLDTSAERIARMLTAERRLAADASHQLRTPLTALSMRLEEILATEDPQTVREEASIALTQVERLTEVVQRLLTSSRERRPDSAVRLCIDEVVAQQVEEWRPAFRTLGRSIQVAGEQALFAVATPGSQAQVLACLFENALMHGAGEVRVWTRRVGNSVVVEISDQGDGVDPVLGAQVFERSVSGRNSTGLGLAVARDLAEADGGRLELLQAGPPVFAVFLTAYDASYEARSEEPDPTVS